MDRLTIIGTMLRTSSNGILVVPVPPFEEQRRSTDGIDGEDVARLLDQRECGGARRVALLREAARAVITAAVTGQIDVRNWHGGGCLSRQAVVGG